jgi:hypothetical protein
VEIAFDEHMSRHSNLGRITDHLALVVSISLFCVRTSFSLTPPEHGVY